VGTNSNAEKSIKITTRAHTSKHTHSHTQANTHKTHTYTHTVAGNPSTSQAISVSNAAVDNHNRGGISKAAAPATPSSTIEASSKPETGLSEGVGLGTEAAQDPQQTSLGSASRATASSQELQVTLTYKIACVGSNGLRLCAA
jgi:hypothetical protein